ncbi:hypothetical protein AB0M20_38405 [Actinoplanes sp. NPDC051633]|uniref:hypothetical protein n=1 Tax=Actinoplanes sp. NPDC051633 TaxID=3155670 RepID=UPI003413C981
MTTIHPTQNPTTLNAPRTPRRSGAGWFVTGTILLLTALVLLITGVVVRVIDESWRRDGYLTSGDIALTTPTRAIATERLDIAGIAPLWPDYDGLLGKLRLRVSGTGGEPVFIGVAPADKAEAYLNGVGHATLTELEDPVTAYAEHAGGAPRGNPADQTFWTAQSTGSGVQAVEWPLTDGEWTVVVMNADGSTGVDASLDVGITAPVQRWAAQVLLGMSAFVGLIALLLIFVGFRRRR